MLGVWAQTQKWIRENKEDFIAFVTEQAGGDPQVTKLRAQAEALPEKLNDAFGVVAVDGRANATS